MFKKGLTGPIAWLVAAAVTAAVLVPVCALADDDNSAFEIKPLYIFQNKAGRDPFTPRYRTGVLPSMLKVDISTFTLVGITQSNGSRAALFRSKTGVQTGYIFMDGRLTTDNDVVVTDVAGVFKNDTEIMLKQGDKEVLFTLPKTPPVSPIIRPDDIETGKDQPGEY